ncbi:MAG: polymer-forming cytoskeletal protein [Alphaproteobacteria bacterium]|nr:polymer-forming cytoskeletal protein [Alphaproteobacteria bacterium]
MFTKSTNQKSAQKQTPSGKPKMPSIISENLKVFGNLESDGEIQVDGMVEGDVKTSSLTVSEGASVRGAIEAETVSIVGNVTGQIKAKSVSFLAKARVIADVIQESLSIEPGAYFEGNARRMEDPKKPKDTSAPQLADGTVATLPGVAKKPSDEKPIAAAGSDD